MRTGCDRDHHRMRLRARSLSSSEPDQGDRSVKIRSVPMSIVLAVLIGGCGGGSTDDLSFRRALADDAEAGARELLVTSICKVDQECSFVTFEDAFPSCSQGRHEPVLITSPSASAASAAAATQRTLAREARTAPGNNWDFACAAYVEPLPTPYCDHSQCKLKSGFPIISLPG